MLRRTLPLVKPRIVALLLLTGVSGVFAAGGTTASTLVAFAVAGGCIAAGSAAINCWYDRDIDPLMERTADRPLPTGELGTQGALGIAGVLLAVGTLVGFLALPLVSVAYMWLGLAAYVGLYTVGLKRRHWMGVVLGGSAGSFPVLAGWTAVRPLEPVALAMATVVFVWTPAHAWALAHVYRDDFAAAGVPTLPVVADPQTVNRAIWCSSIATVGTALVVIPLAGGPFAVAAIVASPLYLLAYHSHRVVGSEATAVRAFFTSNLYLAVLFAAWGLDGMVGPSGPLLFAEAVVVPLLFVRMWAAAPALRGVRGAVGGEWRVLARRVGRLFPRSS